MDRMLVVVFSNEEKAIEGSAVLRGLEVGGYIAVYDAAIVVKDVIGTTTAKRIGEYEPLGTLRGVAVGSLIGLLGGPAGMAIGFAGGTLIGALADLENARVGSDFIEDAAKELVPGKAALVAEIDEDEITPLDMRMEALGGHVLRRSLRGLKHAENEQDFAALKAEIAQSKAEHASATAERKVKLEARIDALNAKLQTKLDHAKVKREAIRGQVNAKLEALKGKAAQARGNIKTRHEKRLAAATKEFDKAVERLEEEQAAEELYL